DQLAILVAAFLVLLDAFALFVFAPALADQVGEHHAPQTPAPRRAADQYARQPAVLVAAFLFVLDALDILAAILAPLAQDAREEQATQAVAADRSAAGQMANKLFVAAAEPAGAIEGRCVSHEVSSCL
ncbi:MAG TPA: hypothetical protein VJS38_03085, partial [Phenylobacterium sp.]|nr:hypothetical protein [Phenylobacterium sp.]